MNSHPLSEALKHSEIIIDRAAIDAAIEQMATQIAADYTVGAPPVFLPIMHGAMLFASQLALELGGKGVDLTFDYIHVSRYNGEETGSHQLVWQHRPKTPLFGRRVLIADDILDEGYTLAAVSAWCLEQGASDVRIVVLATKDHDRATAGIVADYKGLRVPDRYVFGFGMDYHEQGRNLPDIHALK